MSEYYLGNGSKILPIEAYRKKFGFNAQTFRTADCIKFRNEKMAIKIKEQNDRKIREHFSK
jgi:hypothetical protein